MKNLQDLLKRISQALGQDVLGRETAAACIKEIAGFDLEPENIFIKGETLEITTNPVKKNEIKLNEAKILSALSTRTGLKLKRIFYK